MTWQASLPLSQPDTPTVRDYDVKEKWNTMKASGSSWCWRRSLRHGAAFHAMRSAVHLGCLQSFGCLHLGHARVHFQIPTLRAVKSALAPNIKSASSSNLPSRPRPCARDTHRKVLYCERRETPLPFIVFMQMLPIRARFIIFSHCNSSAQPHQS